MFLKLTKSMKALSQSYNQETMARDSSVELPHNCSRESDLASSPSHHSCWGGLSSDGTDHITHTSMDNPKELTGSPSWTWVDLFLWSAVAFSMWDE